MILSESQAIRFGGIKVKQNLTKMEVNNPNVLLPACMEYLHKEDKDEDRKQE